MLSSWDSSLNECQRIAGKNVVEQLIALPPSPFLSLPSAHLASPSIHRHFTQYLLISYWGMPFLWAWTPAALLSLPQAALSGFSLYHNFESSYDKERETSNVTESIDRLCQNICDDDSRETCPEMMYFNECHYKGVRCSSMVLLTFPKSKPVLSAAYLVNHWFLYLLNSISVFRVMHNHLHPRYNVTSFALKEGNWMRVMSELH